MRGIAITNEAADRAVGLYASGWSYAEIESLTGVSRAALSGIVNDRSRSDPNLVVMHDIAVYLRKNGRAAETLMRGIVLEEKLLENNTSVEEVTDLILPFVKEHGAEAGQLIREANEYSLLKASTGKTHPQLTDEMTKMPRQIEKLGGEIGKKKDEKATLEEEVGSLHEELGELKPLKTLRHAMEKINKKPEEAASIVERSEGLWKKGLTADVLDAVATEVEKRKGMGKDVPVVIAELVARFGSLDAANEHAEEVNKAKKRQTKKLDRMISVRESARDGLDGEIVDLSGRLGDLRKEYTKLGKRYEVRERALEAEIATKEKEAKQYWSSTVTDANTRAAATIAEANRKSEAMVTEATRTRDAVLSDASKRSASMLTETKNTCRVIHEGAVGEGVSIVAIAEQKGKSIVERANQTARSVEDVATGEGKKIVDEANQSVKGLRAEETDLRVTISRLQQQAVECAVPIEAARVLWAFVTDGKTATLEQLTPLSTVGGKHKMMPLSIGVRKVFLGVVEKLSSDDLGIRLARGENRLKTVLADAENVVGPKLRVVGELGEDMAIYVRAQKYFEDGKIATDEFTMQNLTDPRYIAMVLRRATDAELEEIFYRASFGNPRNWVRLVRAGEERMGADVSRNFEKMMKYTEVAMAPTTGMGFSKQPRLPDIGGQILKGAKKQVASQP